MLKRTIVIENPCKITISKCQLCIESSTGATAGSVPVEDLGCVVIENQQALITIPAVNELLLNNVNIVICDRKGMPSGMIHTLDGNTLQGERCRIQLNATLPAKKSIWKQIVEAKITNQALVLEKIGKHSGILHHYSREVKSDDATNREGIAANVYWRELFGSGFIRDRFGTPPNNLLNYGYSILRSATARAIASSGLLPAIGIHHRNRYNAFPLADDIMEPFRPWIDITVFRLFATEHFELDKESKQKLINILYADTEVNGKRHPLTIALSILCTSIISVMEGSCSKIRSPRFIDLEL